MTSPTETPIRAEVERHVPNIQTENALTAWRVCTCPHPAGDRREQPAPTCIYCGRTVLDGGPYEP